jgi:hypothetical protein
MSSPSSRLTAAGTDSATPPRLSRSRSRKCRHRHSLGSRRVEKHAVARDNDDVRVTDPVGGREMNRVISAQSTSFGQLASAASEGIITFDEVDLLEQGSRTRSRRRAAAAL